MVTKIICAVAVIAVLAASALAQDAPPLLKQINNGNWLDEAEAIRVVFQKQDLLRLRLRKKCKRPVFLSITHNSELNLSNY